MQDSTTMNRAGGQPRQAAPVPAGYRSAQPPTPSAANGMYYTSSGQHSSGGGAPTPSRGGLMGQQQQQLGSFPPSSTLGRGGPPGFGGRGADPNDFPALGSHSQLGGNSSYAAQAQPSGGSNHLQQMFLHQQQQMDSSLPPPPPGLAGPTSSSTQQPNGAPSGGEGLRDDFPALGDKDQRVVNLLKMGGAPGPAQPSSPQQSLNGPSTSQSTSATPSSNPPHLASAGGPPSTTDSSWARQSPSRPNEPLVRPVQQIMSSPVDKWGLKALLYEIRTQMGKGDRGMLMFGEDLNDLGVDVAASEPLYSSFVTPWADPSSIQHPPQIEDMFVIPSCYHVVPPPVETKLPNFSEETLFYIFYSAPQDVAQLAAAEELYNRGWRFNTDLRVWLTSGPLSQIDLHNDASSRPQAVRGPFTVFNPATWSRQDTAADFTIETHSLEATRPASAIAAEKSSRKEAVRSPNGNNNAGLLSAVMGSGNEPYQNMQVAH